MILDALIFTNLKYINYTNNFMFSINIEEKLSVHSNAIKLIISYILTNFYDKKDNLNFIITVNKNEKLNI